MQYAWRQHDRWRGDKELCKQTCMQPHSNVAGLRLSQPNSSFRKTCAPYAAAAVGSGGWAARLHTGRDPSETPTCRAVWVSRNYAILYFQAKDLEFQILEASKRDIHKLLRIIVSGS